MHGGRPLSKRGINAASFSSKWPIFVSILMYVTALPPNKEVAAGWIPVSDKSQGEVFVCVCVCVCAPVLVTYSSSHSTSKVRMSLAGPPNFKGLFEGSILMLRLELALRKGLG